ncbi:U2 snRNP complex subunit [Sorochytrium milnesiophthora]
MVKLTAELVVHADAYTNALKDRELDLRGQRIPAIENLGATRNQFDCLNLSENDIKVLGNFPLLPRLSMLLLANNRVSKIDSDLSTSVGGLRTLVLTNNFIGELGDLDPLGELIDLEHLSLAGNPVTRRKHYREYVIWRVKSLRVLDFQRIRHKERQAAKALFTTKSGKVNELAKSISATRSSNAGAADDESSHDNHVARSSATAGLSPEETLRIKEAIKNAKSLSEIQKLEELLSKGRVPQAQEESVKDEDGDVEME